MYCSNDALLHLINRIITIIFNNLKSERLAIMMKFKKVMLSFALLSLFGFSWPFSWLFSHPNNEVMGTAAWLNKEVQIIESQANNIDPTVLRLGLKAYLNAHQRGLDSKQILTVIDYSKPSTEKRLWVFDLKHNRTLYNTWVSHGKNSGGINATSFSNADGSLKSSLGLFLTEEPYMGGNGYSLRLRGLEAGVNDHAYERSVVVHGAWYVNPDTIRRYGQIGRSWGCPAVDERLAKPLINTIKENTLVFAYYPDRKWLSHSNFLA